MWLKLIYAKTSVVHRVISAFNLINEVNISDDEIPYFCFLFYFLLSHLFSRNLRAKPKVGLQIWLLSRLCGRA